MKELLRKYAWSFVGALILTLLVGAVSSVERLSAVGVLLAPGMLGAAIFLPEGAHSDSADTYLALALLMNAFLLAWPLLWLWVRIGRARQRN
jgi:hypothetical protein